MNKQNVMPSGSQSPNANKAEEQTELTADSTQEEAKQPEKTLR